MITELHPANERGHANHGWLNTFHSFSFATYFNPRRERFGCLRVLNDDTVSGGEGFDLHPHNNMEIVTIVLEGALEHRDSLGNMQVINRGEVQVMSAGTGIYHSEYNHYENEEVKFFQIWIFPQVKGLHPRYDQKLFSLLDSENELITFVTPANMQSEESLWIHQQAYVSMINLSKDHQFTYSLRIPGNSLFIMLVEGNATVEGNQLKKRDAVAATQASKVEIRTGEQANLLIIEVPMK
jgi:quercetin 2,3-dioxygenase